LKHISGRTPSTSAVPVRRPNKGFFLRVINYDKIFRSSTKWSTSNITHIHTEDIRKNGPPASSTRTITTLAPILIHPLALQPNQMARYEHCKPSLRTQKSNGAYIFIRQPIVNDFTFFVRPTDKLLTGNTEKRDGT
jgi:hypothetical protein